MVSAPISDLDTAECCLLNAALRLKRGVSADAFTAEEYAAIRKHLDAASAHLRLARVALDPPALLAIANEGPR